MLGVMILAFMIAFSMWRGGITQYYRDTLTQSAFSIWFGSLLGASFAPPAIAVGFWRTSSRLPHAWMLHLLVFPATLGVVRACETLMLRVTNEPDGDGLTGWATSPALLLTLVCPAAYYLMLALRQLRKRKSFRRH